MHSLRNPAVLALEERYVAKVIETVGDLDFLVASSEPKPIMDWFVAYPGVKEVTAHGETKSSVRFENGLQADLRVVPAESYGAALLAAPGFGAGHGPLGHEAVAQSRS